MSFSNFLGLPALADRTIALLRFFRTACVSRQDYCFASVFLGLPALADRTIVLHAFLCKLNVFLFFYYYFLFILGIHFKNKKKLFSEPP